MRDTPNLERIYFEKKIPSSILNIKYKKYYLWPLIRIDLLNHVFANTKVPNSKLHTQENSRKIFKKVIILCNFISFILSNRRPKVMYRLNSFSLKQSKDGAIKFKNEALINTTPKDYSHIVIVNNLTGYEIDNVSGNNVTFFPQWFISFLSRLFFTFYKNKIDSATTLIATSIQQPPELIKRKIAFQIISINTWRLIYKLLKPQGIYFECPQNCFEAEIVAAKLENIQTIEIFHGVVTLNEIAYQHQHLNLTDGVCGYCHTYLALSVPQIAYVKQVSIFDNVELASYKVNEELKQEYHASVKSYAALTNTVASRLLIMTSLCDYAIERVDTWVTGKALHDQFIECSIRLHPEDDIDRWQPFLAKHSYFTVSKKSFIEDIMPNNYIVAVSSTVVLQLRELKINFIDLSENI